MARLVWVMARKVVLPPANFTPGTEELARLGAEEQSENLIKEEEKNELAASVAIQLPNEDENEGKNNHKKL